MFERLMIDGGETEVVLMATVMYDAEDVANDWDVVVLVARVLSPIEVHRASLRSKQEVKDFFHRIAGPIYLGPSLRDSTATVQ